MRVIKPMTLCVLHKPYRYQGRNHFVVAALGFFRLGAPVERFLTDNLQWPQVVPLLPAGQPLDALMPKPRGEVLLAARAYAPDGRPVPAMTVCVAVAGVDKALRVLGNREWMYGLVPWYRIGQPEPFVEMPIDYEHAYGGARHQDNPVGRGHTGNRFAAFAGRNAGPMPNIEYADQPVKSNCKRYRPAGFGPIDLRWSPRKDKRGTYDQRWLAEDFPGLARDTDWSVFNTAPEDQQIDGYFEGNEPYRLEGMHPQHPVIEGRLPDMRARAFVLRGTEPAANAEEVPLAMDTVWFFPDRELGVAVYRGRCVVGDSDALDVTAVMAGYERRGDEPRPLAHYREVMALRTQRETALLHAFNESQLTPEKTEAERMRQAEAQALAEAAELNREQALLDEMSADFWSESGMEKPADYVPPKASPSPLGVLAPGAVAQGDFDLTAFTAKAKALADDAKRQGDDRMKALQEEKAATLDPMVAEAQARVPQPSPEVQRAAAAERAKAAARDLVKASDTAAQIDARLDGLTEAMNAAERAGHKVEESVRRQIADAIAQEPAQRRKARRAAPTPSAPAEALSAELAAWLGEQARRWYAAGSCLAGHDLAGADLRGADFSGADLHEILLERADLRGARFRGADLRGAAFTGAALEGADFSGARLDEANFSASHGRGVRFAGASLARVMAIEAALPAADLSGAAIDTLIAHKADLSGALFDDARMVGALFLEARAAGSSWRRARMEKCVAMRAELEGADFSGASLSRCALLHSNLRSSAWTGAQLSSVQGGGTADWSGAVLREVRARKCGLRGAVMRGADLGGGQFVECDFGDTDLSGAVLEGGLFYRSLFMGSRLAGCRARGADFFQALCRKADFGDADLSEANLAQADLSEAVMAGATLDGARLDPNRRAA